MTVDVQAEFQEGLKTCTNRKKVLESEVILQRHVPAQTGTQSLCVRYKT